MVQSTTMRSTALGAALAALTALACLWVAAGTDPPTCSLAELATRQSVLMSCEDAGPVSVGLLWCADPSSPQCIPALPQAPRPELWDRPDIALPTVVAPARRGYVWMTWPEPEVLDMPGRTWSQRLERPPRA